MGIRVNFRKEVLSFKVSHGIDRLEKKFKAGHKKISGRVYGYPLHLLFCSSEDLLVMR
jgi:hypothetical protein